MPAVIAVSDASPSSAIIPVLRQHAERIPSALAVLSPARSPLTYGRLYGHIAEVVDTLQAVGLHHQDRVALVLPNGPELAVAILAVMAGATCAPLNPAYSPNEFAAHLADLRAKALIVQAGMDSPVRAVAQARGLPIIELMPVYTAAAGVFSLTGVIPTRVEGRTWAHPEEVALVLSTSGTTARPKLVPLTHAAVYASAYNICVSLDLTASDRCLQVLPLFHTYGLMGPILASLLAGASVVCTPGFAEDSFFAWMAAFHPTWYAGVPALHQAILAHAEQHREIIRGCALRFIRSASAPLSVPVRTALEEVLCAPVLESYGMTETSVIACNPPPKRPYRPGSLGLPVGLEVAILDEQGRRLPAGNVGEIVVRGPSVMSGYANDPAANQYAFTQGWFRTGDQGFLDADGYLFMTGRVTELINRGGEKIAPGEVDAVLMQHPAVAQAVTFAVPHTRLGEDVAAAVVLRHGATAMAGEIRRFAAMHLAEFKVPAQVLIVEAIPVGPTEKPQRRRLAEQLGFTLTAQPRTDSRTSATGPRTPVEELLVGIWTQVLPVESVNVDEDFFQLGGDSLSATQLLSRVREVVHADIPFRSFFARPTVAGMAAYIATTRRPSSGLSALPLRPAPRHQPLPLSYQQTRLWLLDQLKFSRQAYYLLDAMRLRGPLQVSALTRSLEAMSQRHEVFRTTFVNHGEQPVQVIATTSSLPLQVVDWQDVPEDQRQARVQRLAQQEIQRPFDLAQGPLLRATLARLAETEHILLLSMHHIVSDGWSHSVFWREMTALYNAFAAGQPSPLPALALQYADFADAQQQCLQAEALETPLAYWKRQLAGVPTLHLPTDHPRPALQSFQGSRQAFTLAPTLTQALKALSRQHGVTLFMTLLAAFQTLLQRFTGQDDFAVGTLIANRERVELEGLIGFLVNTLVLRVDLSGDPSFRELLRRVREVTLGAYEYQDVPYEKLLEALRPPRDLSRNALFQVMCILHNTPPPVLELTDLMVEPIEVDPGTARFDVTLEFWDTPAGLQGRFEYNTDLFDAATIARMAGHLQTLLEGVVSDPDQRLSCLPLLTAAERQQLLVEWNATTAAYPAAQGLQDVFERQASRTPDAVALVCGEESLTYDELNRHANQLANYLQALGVQAEMLVGLCLERSLAMVVGLLGILKAGAAYVPLDPSYPAERLAFMLEDARPPVVLTHGHLAAGLSSLGARLVCLDAHWPAIAQYGHENPTTGATADTAAYLLYTSGSSGRPKGVLGLHGATLNALAWMSRTFPFAEHEVCCQKTSISFGDSIQELLGPLLHGIRLVLMPPDLLRDPSAFVRLLAVHAVTRLMLVPSLLRVLLDTYHDLQDRLPSLRLWFAGGEPLSSDLVLRFRRCLPFKRLVNLYGASEASDDTTWYDTSGAGDTLITVPIGCPIANTQVYVLDHYLQPVPIGVPGELYVGGASLTRGYLKRPDLTAERFIPHPFSPVPGERLYRTGDVVRYRADAQLECLGRVDYQVKLRGIRIELGEIEAVLAQHPAVQQAVVVRHQDRSGERRLIAYVVPTQELRPSLRELRSFLAKQLPAAMIPTVFVMLETLPLTPSGKVNRQALPLPPPLRPDLEGLYAAPRTPLEQQVAALWCQVLGLEQVGIYDNFFELGGHSLLAMQLLFRLRQVTHAEVPLLRFFETPTVAGMAALMATAEQTEAGRPVAPIVSIPRQGPVPASIAQEHFWFFDQLLPGMPVFNISQVVRLQGPLQVATLEQSLNAIIDRHESLRTTFARSGGELVQRIAPRLHLPVTIRDLQSWPADEREQEAQRVIHQEGRHVFDLAQGPLLRSCVLKLSQEHHLLVVTLHHIISDGWSLGVLLHELAVLYDACASGRPSPLPTLPIQYADFAAWQRQWEHDAMMRAQLTYWQEQLREPLPALALATHYRRRPTAAWRMARQPLELPSPLVDALKGLSQREGSTLFMTCLAAFNILLYGYTGQEDIRVATLVANRTRAETEGLIGLLVNMVILRTNLSGNPTSRQVLQHVRSTTLAAFAHQDLPFEELVRTLERERNFARKSLSQVMVIWQNFIHRPLQWSGPTLTSHTVDQGAVVPEAPLTTFDITLTLHEKPAGIAAMCLYNAERFDAVTMQRLLDDFQHVLTCLSTQPEQALASFRSMLSHHGYG